ncbi:MAG: hypothetical protein JKY48_05070, partial [Flavobacteriales bacterium]|nr:hypothetical protein [Flavobacteriales bacterium]
MDNNSTLQQGLDEFHKKNRKYFSESSSSKEEKEFLICHDITHIVFGCNTTIYGEGLVKIWTTFGITLSFWNVVKGYDEANAFKLFKTYSFSHILKNIVHFLV